MIDCDGKENNIVCVEGISMRYVELLLCAIIMNLES
jgi:hypothetical protein